MRPSSPLPARRSLLARPQRLGLLPTLWFWNDHEHQRRILPLIVVTAVPLSALASYLRAPLQLDGWLPIAFALVYPTLIMGLVERHIRGALADPARGTGLAVLLVCVGLGVALAPTSFGFMTLLALVGAAITLALLPRRPARADALPPAHDKQ